MSATASSLPATIGCVASGSQIHTYASVGCSEVILHVSPTWPHPLREQRDAVAGPVQIDAQVRAILVKERHAGKGGRLERHAKAHRQIAVLDPGERGRRDAGALGQLPHRPTPFAPGKTDARPEELCGLDGVGGICASSLHDYEE